MAIKAFIFDLDNTIYSVQSVGEQMFHSLFKLIEEDGSHAAEMEEIKQEVMRIPFQKVATKHHFSQRLTTEAESMLKELTYQGQMEPFEDFELVRTLPQVKFLVTTGFYKLQKSKVETLQLDTIFKEVHIVDPDVTDRTKKDVFEDILTRHNMHKSEVLVIGDDPDSEIKAAKDLNIPAVLYDKLNRFEHRDDLTRISDYSELALLLSEGRVFTF